LKVKLHKIDPDIALLQTWQASGGPRDRMAAYALSFALLRVYNSFEDVMRAIAKTVDGSVLGDGAGWHQALVDQMSAEIPDTRPAILTGELLAQVESLKNFRHKANHDYGMSLDFDRIAGNVANALGAMDGFVASLERLQNFFAAADKLAGPSA